MIALPALTRTFEIVEPFFERSMPEMPPETWWLAALVLLILGLAASIDTFTSNVPDPLIFLGLLALTALQGLEVSWPFAATHLTWALGAAFALWAINQLWYLTFKRDAIGMGDAKWTMLAVAAFDIMPGLFAWGLGACLALIWMGALLIIRRPVNRVYFAPFLFIGLVAGLYWLRYRV
jgi:prepilin signal peptidase PulO-like enzyme (type II secretory pathway)